MTEACTRRAVLRAGVVAAGAVAGGTVTGGAVADASARGAVPDVANEAVFRHGVASGDPTADRVILWTRVTPTPDALPGSGVGPTVEVGWEVAIDESFDRIVRSGTTHTGPERDHTVRVDVDGLSPATTYRYRFTLGDVRSPEGRTHTVHAPGTSPDRLRFAVVSCANWEAGYFSTYRHLADRGDLDAVVHLGDYIYEYGTGEYAGPHDIVVREHDPLHEIVTLADYRTRHGQYKTDPDLLRLHAAVPFVVMWDDHELADNAARDGAANHTPGVEGDWTDRRAAALQAYLEWMPLRPPSGDRLYRRLAFGDLAELSMLDLRSYRDAQPDAWDGATIDAPGRTITGPEQMRWLTDGIASSSSRWQLVGSSVMFAPLTLAALDPATSRAMASSIGVPGDGIPVNPDQWDGYGADRARVIDAIRSHGGGNVVFLAGDIHMSWASDVPLAVRDFPSAGTVAVEFTVPSVTSNSLGETLGVPPRTASVHAEDAVRASNPHVRYCELDSHGFGVLEVSSDAVQLDWMYVLDITDPATGVRHGVSLRTEHGRPGLLPAARLP